MSSPPRALGEGGTPWLALGAIVLFGLCLRVAGLDHQSFWIDEIASLEFAEDSVAEGFQRIRKDVHPPGYFALLQWWIQAVGHSESAVRWLSVIPSLLTIGALFRLGRLLYGQHSPSGRRIGVMAGLISAGSLIQIYYAQEARSYAWLMLLATLSMDATVRFAARSNPNPGADPDPDPNPDRPQMQTRPGISAALVSYSVTTAALLYCHYFAFFILAAQNLFILALWWREPTAGPRRLPLGRWFVAQAVVALSFLPWLPSLLAQTQAVRQGFWIREPSLSALGTAFIRLSSLAGPWSPGGPAGSFGWLSLAAACGVCLAALAGAALAVRGLRASRKAERTSGIGEARRAAESAHLLLGLWLLLPALAGWSLSLVGLDVFTYRNTMVSAPALSLLLAALCNRFSRPAWRAAAVATVLAPSLVQLPGYYGEPHKDQWREAAQQVLSGYVASTDGIAFDAPFIRKSFLHYAPELAGELAPAAPGSEARAAAHSAAKPSAQPSGRGVDLMADSAPEYARIWLVRAYAGPRSRSPQKLARWGYEPLQHAEWVAIEVFLFSRHGRD